MSTETPVSFAAAVLIPTTETGISSVEELKADILGRFIESSERKDIEKAINFATKVHGTQKRNTGDPFIVHPLRAMRFALDNLDVLFPSSYLSKLLQVIALHDVIEDTPVTKDELEREFGWDVATSVDLLSKKRNKVWKEEYRPKNEGDQKNKPYLANLRRLSELTDRSIPPLVVMMVCEAKACDRWENVHTIDTLALNPKDSEDRKKDYLIEARIDILELLNPSHPLYGPLLGEIKIQANKLNLE